MKSLNIFVLCHVNDPLARREYYKNGKFDEG